MKKQSNESARFFDMLRFIAGSLGRGTKALFRRIFLGPKRPSWGIKMEGIIGLQGGTYNLLSKIGPLRYHRAVEALIPRVVSGDATVEISEADGLPGHWFVPEQPSDAVILYFHGGGYVYGSVKTHGEMIGAIACSASAKTFALDYRLAPTHPQPAAIEDACQAFHRLIEMGVPPERIVFAGDSAGGGLVIAAMLALREEGSPLPAAGVAISPWVDLTCSDDSFDRNARYDSVTREACLVAASAYLNGLPADSPIVSPLFASLDGLPPLLVHSGEVEVLHDQICSFAERATSANVDVTLSVYPDMVHVWHMLVGFTPHAQAAIDEIGTFVKTQVTKA